MTSSGSYTDSTEATRESPYRSPLLTKKMQHSSDTHTEGTSTPTHDQHHESSPQHLQNSPLTD